MSKWESIVLNWQHSIHFCCLASRWNYTRIQCICMVRIFWSHMKFIALVFDTYQYWNIATSKLVGYCEVTSSAVGAAGAEAKSGTGWLAVSVLLGEGGLDVSCVCDNVVMKFRFRWTASYSANKRALFARICWTRSQSSSDTNILPTILDNDDNHDDEWISVKFCVYCRQKSIKDVDIICP